MCESNYVLDKLIIATKNPGKTEEMKILLQGTAKELVTYKDIDWDSPEETGVTFEENAILKASYVMKKTGIPTVSDDTGLCIDELDGLPGIFTSRWADNGKNYIKGIEHIEKLLNDKQSKASYVSCLAFCLPNGERCVFKGIIYGNIVFPSRGKIIGYESIFVPNGYNTTLSSLRFDIRMKIHHRTKCVEKFKDFLKTIVVV